MSYNPTMGMIPGYDTLVRYRNANKMQNDWNRNVGSKGRKMAYDTYRYDYGSVRQAMSSLYNDAVSIGSSFALPFKR